MFNSIFRKIYWKEFRTLWPLWMAVAVLYMFIVMAAWFATYDEPTQVDARNYGIFLVAAMLPALYGLGSAGTQFAWELESGMFKRLRSLPATSGQVAWAKLAWTISSTILLGVTLWGASYLMTGGKAISSQTLWAFANVYSFAALEAIAWGAIVSLRSRSPLIATIIAGTVGMMAFGFEMAICQLAKFSGVVGSKEQWATYAAAWPIRLMVLLPLTLAVIYLARHWFDYWRNQESQGSEHDSLFDMENYIPKTYITGDGGFTALCQQCWHRNKKIWFITSLLPITGLCLGALFSLDSSSADALIILPLWGLAFACTIVASNTFGADQSDQGFRFFAHHGIKTSKVWFSRLLVSGLFFSILWCIGIAIFCSKKMQVPEFLEYLGIVFAFGLALGSCLFMIGMFFSILCKSRVLAWTWTFGVSIGCWSLIVFLWLFQVSVLLILILVLGLMLCSYLGLADKIHERSGLRTWLKKLSPLAVCIIIFIGLTITLRVQSIPDVEIEPKMIADYEQAWKSPESTQLLEELRSLKDFGSQSVKEVDSPPQWLQPEAQADIYEPLVVSPPKFNDFSSILSDSNLNKLLRVANSSKEPDWSQLMDWNTSDEKRKTVEHLTRLRHCLFNTAEYYSRTGEPEKSLDCLLAAIRLSPPWNKTSTATIVFDLMPQWSIGPGVTPELIQQAIQRIVAVPSTNIDLQRTLIAKYLQTQEVLNDMDLLQKRMGSDHRMLFTILPWELARVKRISKLSVMHSIKSTSFWEQGSRFGFGYSDLAQKREEISSIDLVLDKTREGILDDIAVNYEILFPAYYEDYEDFRAMELFRRLAITSLAIRAYQLQHDGALPKALYNATEMLTDHLYVTMPGGPTFDFREEGFEEDTYLQPGLNFTDYKRPGLVDNVSLSGIPCIVLDRDTLTGHQSLDAFSEENDNLLLNLPEQQFYSLPTVYPLPFGEKKHEGKKEE